MAGPGYIPDTIWVICEDYGYYGLRTPFQAFLRESEAKAALALMEAPLASHKVKLCEVPLWPNHAKRDAP